MNDSTVGVHRISDNRKKDGYPSEYCCAAGSFSWTSKPLTLENIGTYLYLASLQLLYLDLCWEKTLFPALPLSILAFIQADWLIDFLIKYFLSFLPAGTLMYICLLMYPVQMLSLMYWYLIFAKKQRIMFFDPPGGWVGQNFFTLIVLDSANHWAPFPGLLCKTDPLAKFLGTFYIIGTQAAFSPKNKMYFICSKENDNLL